MGSNNNQNQDTSQQGGNSGNDPRGRLQNQSNYQQNRFESQQGPLANATAMNYGRGSEADYGNYTDIMNQYRNVASGQGAGAVTGGGGGFASGAYGGPGYSAFTVTPEKASYTDPFASYSKFQDLSKTGGYSDQDMADLRARGTSPVRAAYANAEREVNRGRALQGGYSANSAAAQAKMAREQSQSAADAMQNVNAGIIGARNAGQLAGMQGMSGIEGQRLGADVDVSKFNTGLNYQGQTYNADAQARAQAGNIGIGQSNAAANASAQNQGVAAANSAANAAAARQMQALGGMTQLYGTTPGMSATFGNQALGAVNAGGNFGNNLYGNDINSQRAPGAFDTTMGRIGQIANMGSNAVYPWLDPNNRQQGSFDTGNGTFGGPSTVDASTDMGGYDPFSQYNGGYGYMPQGGTGYGQ
jgi:hypothetical protein